jgi:hypothetical protein
MPYTRASRFRTLTRSITFVALLSLASASSFAQSESVLYAFQGGSDASRPQSSLVADGAGNLYGTTVLGGSGCSNNVCGAVFRLSPPTTTGGSWTETVIYNFQGGTDGIDPVDGLILDKSGNLYGTTIGGGTGPCPTGVAPGPGCGVVFELSPPTSGGAWTETILYNFQGGTDGSYPWSPLVFDQKGNLYGTTWYGGSSFCESVFVCGTVYRLSPPATQGGAWTERILHSFNFFGDGSSPTAGVMLGSNGAVYGTTRAGGNGSCAIDGQSSGCGSVFQLTPPPYAAGGWKESVYSFRTQGLGAFPVSNLVVGRNGALYGTTPYGGTAQTCFDSIGSTAIGCGAVFEITPPTTAGGPWRETTIYSFAGLDDGAYPQAGLVVDGKGNIYGTAAAGGGAGSCSRFFDYTNGCGTVFKLSPPASHGGSWTETTVHSFAGGSDGANPWAGLTSDGKGGFYGTTYTGGNQTTCGAWGCGTIFHIVP